MTQYKSPQAWDETRPDPTKAQGAAGPSPADERKASEPYELGNLPLAEATRLDPRIAGVLPSTKGLL